MRRVHPELQDKPIVLTVSGKRGAMVSLCSRRAIQSGVRPGMPAAEAVALNRNVLVLEQDDEQDRRGLERMAVWAERYSPIVSLEDGPNPSCLLLDVAGCAPYFGGEDKLLQRAHHELHAEGWMVRAALADSLGAAWALAHYAVTTPFLTPPSSAEKALRPLPVASLRLPFESLTLLTKLGVERVEQLMQLPREGLPARVGAIVLQRLDQALGATPEILRPHRVAPTVQTFWSSEHPISQRSLLNCIVEHLIKGVRESLLSLNKGARVIECCLHHEASTDVSKMEISFVRPNNDAAYLSSMLCSRLEQVPLTAPVYALTLRVKLAEPLISSQISLFDLEQNSTQKDLIHLVDRLRSRLGSQAVMRVVLISDPQPEFACALEPWLTAPTRLRKPSPKPSKRRLHQEASTQFCWDPTLLPRPLHMWTPPMKLQAAAVVPDGPLIRFCLQGTEYRVLRSWGPETIAAGWWRDVDVERAYFRVATEQGPCFWIFRQEDQWFLHGRFD